MTGKIYLSCWENHIIFSMSYAMLSEFATRFAACGVFMFATKFAKLTRGICVFHRGTLPLNYYKMVGMGYLSCVFIQIQSSNMCPMYLHYMVSNHFTEDLLSFQHRIQLFLWLRILKTPPNSGGNMQIFGYLGHFLGRGNIFGLGGTSGASEHVTFSLYIIYNPSSRLVPHTLYIIYTSLSMMKCGRVETTL